VSPCACDIRRATDPNNIHYFTTQRLDKRYAAVQRRLADVRCAELERENEALVSRLRVAEHDTQQLELTVRAPRKELSTLDSFKVQAVGLHVAAGDQRQTLVAREIPSSLLPPSVGMN
jgi:hypothetical protein